MAAALVVVLFVPLAVACSGAGAPGLNGEPAGSCATDAECAVTNIVPGNDCCTPECNAYVTTKKAAGELSRDRQAACGDRAARCPPYDCPPPPPVFPVCRAGKCVNAGIPGPG